MSNRSNPRTGRPKMTDIARLAGVSVSTVSRALAGSKLVTDDTRERISRAAGDAGYVVNHVARGLRLQRSRQILLMLPTIANPFFAEVVLGAEQEAQAHGYGVLVGSTSGAPAREEALARHLLTGAVDGLIMLMGRMPEVLSAIAAEDRVVAVSARVPGFDVSTVSIDNVAAAQAAVAHLLALGHRRIAHIAGRTGSIVAAQRLKGYRLGLAVCGIEPEADLIAAGTFSFESGEAAMHRLLALRPRPSAIFCGNDEMAIGAIKAARARGLRVPADLSIVGFDDIPYAAAFDPALTTIQQPRREMGRLAATLLIEQLAGKQTGRGGRELPYQLVIRQSTQPAALPQRDTADGAPHAVPARGAVSTSPA
jgi:LacI family transcriptional regulator, repressor for deo operon, udp, cdd, tsx, nupC, and nupG